MLLPFVIVEFCPEQNINTIRDITLQPLSVYPRVFIYLFIYLFIQYFKRYTLLAHKPFYQVALLNTIKRQ